MNQGMKMISVTSGKGGTGKTCISANLALALAAQGKRVVVFDADLQLANLDVALGIQTPLSLSHVVNGEHTLREVLYDAPGFIRVATGGSAIPALMTAGPKRMATFMLQIEELEQDTDFLIFDTGAGIDNKVTGFLAMSHQAIVVTTPDPSSVTDAYATIKVATKAAPATEIGVLVNMATSVQEANGVHKALNRICGSYLGLEVPMLGYLLQDPDVAVGTRKRRPFFLSAPHSKAAREISALASRVSAGYTFPQLQLAA